MVIVVKVFQFKMGREFPRLAHYFPSRLRQAAMPVADTMVSRRPRVQAPSPPPPPGSLDSTLLSVFSSSASSASHVDLLKNIFPWLCCLISSFKAGKLMHFSNNFSSFVSIQF